MRNFILFFVAFWFVAPAVVYANPTLNMGGIDMPKGPEAETSLGMGSAFQNVVRGNVRSAAGVLSGVTVTHVGGTASTETDAQGNFSINVPNGATLRFTMVGYTTKELVVSGSTLNVVLDEASTNIDEVVVVGYGQQRRGSLTGAVASVNVKENLESRPIADVGRAIQGTTPGLNVVIPSGEVGSDPIIRIRGQIGSFRGTADPLILLDNVEIPSIQVINPMDVESITVLKDASAATIYGAKAAFGVILITTKQGAGQDRVSVEYSNNFSFQDPYKEIKMGRLSALKYSLDAVERTGGTTIGAFYRVNRASYDRAVEWHKQYEGVLGPDDPTVYGRDWYFDAALNAKMGLRTYDPQEYMIRNWAPTNQHHLSVGGTSGKTSFNVGLAALDQSGMISTNTDKFARYNASVRIRSEINDYITLRTGAIYTQREKMYPYATNSTTADPWLYLYRWSSLYPLGLDESGDPIRSPWSETKAANVASLKNNYVNFSVGTTIKLTKNWNFDFDFTHGNEEYINHRPGTKFYGRDSWGSPRVRLDENGSQMYVNAQGQAVSAGDPGAMLAYELIPHQYTADGANPDHVYMLSNNAYNNTINAYTTYNLDLNDSHSFKFMAGINRVTNDAKSHWNQITNLTDILNPQFNYGVGTITGGGNTTWASQLGYFGRVNYAFQNKYLVEASLRYDGSSKFPMHLKWKTFPSASVGWIVSEESFMEPIRDHVNFFKFRGSWGSIGDQSVPNSLYVATMGTGQSTWIGSGGTRLNQVGSPSAVSADISWQNITTLDFGIDARFLRNKLGFTFDLYKRTTEDLIVPLEGVGPTYGVTAPQGNYGKLETDGFEVALDFNHRFENGLGLNMRASLSDAVTTIVQYGSTRSISGWYAGKKYGEIWGYSVDRLYQESDFIMGSDGNPVKGRLTTDDSRWAVSTRDYNLMSGSNPIYQTRLESGTFFFGPGDVKFKDLNGDGEIDWGNGLIDDHGDLSVIGNSTPRYEYGFRLALDFKGFDVSAFFQGIGSRQVWGAGFLAIPGFQASDGAMPAAISDNYWTPETPDAFYPRPWNLAAGATSTSAGYNMVVSDRYLLDMSYLRVKNLTIGYSLPQSLLRRVNVSSLRVYTAFENFFTWDKLGGLPIDPEEIQGYSMLNTSNYNSGRTGVGTPTFKSVSLGLHLNF